MRTRFAFCAERPQDGRIARFLLNLSFWAADAGGDVLADESIDADVVAHAAWHHLAARAFAPEAGGAMPVDALFLGEAIASAFDAYLVGRLLGHAPRSKFLETQVPAMAETANAAGLTKASFARSSRTSRVAPSARSRISASYSATRPRPSSPAATPSRRTPRWPRSTDIDSARSSIATALELGLYARAYGRQAGPDPRVVAVDRALRRSKSPLAWLATRWIAPALAHSEPSPGAGSRTAPRP